MAPRTPCPAKLIERVPERPLELPKGLLNCAYLVSSYAIPSQLTWASGRRLCYYSEEDLRELEVFGRRLLVERTTNGWNTCTPGSDGKREPISTTLVPSFIVTDDELLQYLADLWHEEARPDRQTVRWVE